VNLRDFRRRKMGKGLGRRIFIYSLCVSFLSLMVGSPRWVADARERSLPIGEMVSQGGVKFEVKENVWKNVEPSHFPVFLGVKIKTMADGTAAIALANRCQVEAAQDSILSFDQNDRVHLLRGKIDFRIPSGEEIVFKVGNLTVTKSRAFQASKRPASTLPDEETIGSISVRSNGSVTVRNVQGMLSVLNQDRAVLAAVSSKESVTIPSTLVTGTPRVMVAQVGEAAATSGESTFLGASAGTWLGVGIGVAALGVGIGVAATGSDSERVNCP
jgi:hypothetical protein